MVRPNKRVAGGLAAFAVAAGSVLASAPQAQAAPVKTQVSCDIPADVRQYMGNKAVVTGEQTFTVTGPATAKAGESIKLNVDPGPSPAQGPPLAITVKATSTMEFTTKTGGKVSAKGAAGDLTLTTAGGPIDIKPFDINVTVPNGTKDTFALSPSQLGLQIVVASVGLTIDVKCKTTSTAVAYTVTIPATGGTTPTPSSTPTKSSTPSATPTTKNTNTTTSGGTLPKTGPMDDALSMGLLGGTVGLLGVGGVLLATRRARASRSA